MIIGSCQNLMFPHPWGFVGDQYKTSCEAIALQYEKKRAKVEQDLKIQWKIPFWIFFFIAQHAPIFFYLKKLEKLVKLVGGGSVINGAYPV